MFEAIHTLLVVQWLLPSLHFMPILYKEPAHSPTKNTPKPKLIKYIRISIFIFIILIFLNVLERQNPYFCRWRNQKLSSDVWCPRPYGQGKVKKTKWGKDLFLEVQTRIQMQTEHCQEFRSQMGENHLKTIICLIFYSLVRKKHSEILC
jgi:hypothetical protein